MAKRIADAGFIVAYASRTSIDSKWARAEMVKWGAPFLTCEGALVEAAHFCAPSVIARMVQDKDFVITFDLDEQIGAVLRLLEKYRDQPMDFVDGCIVRMSDLFPDCMVFTLDRDFEFYRRFGGEVIPTRFPTQE